ncbi:hypothetical protein HanRHA438_Chr10g0430771 [Helianthus annuus]|nr:hypothetical protein HanRHA438_Chr10g0430771 [Helianthus annuus]
MPLTHVLGFVEIPNQSNIHHSNSRTKVEKSSNPSNSRISKTLILASALVSISSLCSYPLTYSISTNSFSRHSRMEWYCESMCLLRP